ncbi:MAG: ribonuclease J [Rhodobacteraceae bacterium]|nr:ribonuclease J [Paracoccaceae bacterium]
MSKNDRLIYLPLGGAGEIGMNMYLYGYGPKDNEKFILVDVGVSFPDMESSPGVDLIMADPTYITDRADRLEAIFITHAHEDHIGALGHLFPRLQAPIYCRAFTAAIARNKMERAGQDPEMVNEIGMWPETVQTGPFTVGFVPISHSIPEASALVIDTPAGRIFHSGDFKIDTNPVVGEAFDADLMQDIAKDGITAFVCDSTNVFSPEPGRSESSLPPAITEMMREATGMVVATTFGSNVARLKTLAQAAVDAGRSVVVVGRAMNTMINTGQSTGVLTDFPPIMDLEDSKGIPRNQLMVLATGSQGERRAASAQLAQGKYRGLEMKAGDTFLFSSKTIPGNEIGVARIQNLFAKKGVNVVSGDDRYHVSGHANRPDLLRLQELLNPDLVIPMHGEYRHLREHAELAESNNRKAVIAPNGVMLDITNGAKVIENIDTGRLYLDGSVLIGAMDGIVRQRLQFAMRGHVVVSLMIDEDQGLVDGVWAEAHGLPEVKHGKNGLDGLLDEAIDKDLRKAKRGALKDDEAVEMIVLRACNRVCKAAIGKKPVCTVLINRMVSE